MITPDILIVFTVILVALASFTTEPVPVDVTAVGVMVSLMLIQSASEAPISVGMLDAPIVLFESYPGDAPLGFVNAATLTILAMFIPSEGVQRTDIIQLPSVRMPTFTGDDELRQFDATVGVVGPISGSIDNTTAVVILLPMVTDLAGCGWTSPSKPLPPLSYALIFGGVLTLIGTPTSILASDVYSHIMGEAPFSMLEFTALGVVVMAVGVVYLITIGHRLIPG